LQEINQLIGIELLTSNFLEVLVLSPNFQRGKCPFWLRGRSSQWG